MLDYPFETILTDYQASLSATVMEGPHPTNRTIRADQDSTVHVEMQASGPLAGFLDAEFQLSLHIESIGNGPEFDLGPYIIGTLDGALSYVGTEPQRDYVVDIPLPAGTLPVGVYKMVLIAQLFERSSGNPVNIVALADLPCVWVYEPGT